MTTPLAMRGSPRPVVSVGQDVTVIEAVRIMSAQNISALVVLEGIRLAGVFSERDVLRRVVLPARDPTKTPVSEVMTRTVLTVRENADRSAALRIMTDHHVRHLPVVDVEGRVLTMLSMRDLLRAEMQDLEQTVWELASETAIDGPGG
jgi:CBS domain-containing protein